MVDWAKLVEERNAWVAYNFPTVDTVEGAHVPIQSVQGVIEELGELSHAHLKQAQKIRGTMDQHIRDGMDAVGDMMVYLMGVMNYTGELPSDSRPFVKRDSVDSALLHLSVVVGRLALRVDDTPKAKYFIADSVDRLVQNARHYCDLRSWDFDGIVDETWAGVKQRDWIKYPDTGLPPVDDEEVDATDEALTFWTCHIGPVLRSALPAGSDAPLRAAVKDAFGVLMGFEPDVCSSGWGAREAWS